ncbi:acrylyl-CoA reductase family protein [Carnobacterium gallinarum]|uniref:acrylyl-CoA reductase family protein n=1 Tax=Carnobacterium gallinarum TaxID=2749 RepID=UPI000558BA7B|nr:acryloyl-CoA reductase [Carnobacterium gallinarum]
MTTTFKALVARLEDEEVHATFEELAINDLPQGDVLIEVYYSSVNYKDALAVKAGSGVVRNYPMIPGIDLSGIVQESSNSDFKVGDEVLVTGYKLGTGHFGGFSEFARVPAEWVVHLPAGLSLKEAMIIGTAGFTAALSVHQLEVNGLNPENPGEVLVLGATGGVGSMAIAQLQALGYQQIAAVSRKAQKEASFLTKLGATSILTLEEVQLEKKRPLAKQRWQAVIDPIGGALVPELLAQVDYNGGLALSGNANGVKFDATVFPFILRGIKLLGIDSVDCPMELRQNLWNHLATTMKPHYLSEMVDNEISLTDLPTAFSKILNGEMRGRTVVKVK